MTDLSDLFKDAVGEVPTFDPAALVARQRHRRQFQLVGAASAFVAVAAIAALMIFVTGGSNDNVAVGTRKPHSNDSSSTEAASSTLGFSTTTASIGTTTTASAPNQTTVPGGGSSTTVPDNRSPQPGDFTGTFTAQPTTVHVAGVGVSLDLTIRNATNHTVEPSLGSLTTGVAIICAPLQPDGQPTVALQSDVNLWFVTSPPLAPGEQSGRSATYEPTANDVGTVTCEGVIVSSTDGWRTMTLVARITAIPAVNITVLPEEATTTVPSTP